MSGVGNVNDADLITVGVAALIIVSFTPLAPVLIIGIILFAAWMIWSVLLADLWFDYITLPILIGRSKPEKDVLR